MINKLANIWRVLPLELVQYVLEYNAYAMISENPASILINRHLYRMVAPDCYSHFERILPVLLVHYRDQSRNVNRLNMLYYHHVTEIPGHVFTRPTINKLHWAVGQGIEFPNLKTICLTFPQIEIASEIHARFWATLERLEFEVMEMIYVTPQSSEALEIICSCCARLEGVYITACATRPHLGISARPPPDWGSEAFELLNNIPISSFYSQSWFPVAERVLGALRGFTRLKDLTLGRCSLRSGDWSFAKGMMSSVKKLDLTISDSTPSQLASLLSLVDSLEELRLDFLHHVYQKDLQSLANGRVLSRQLRRVTFQHANSMPFTTLQTNSIKSHFHRISPQIDVKICQNPIIRK